MENKSEKKSGNLSADLYNIVRVLTWIICVGVPLRFWFGYSGADIWLKWSLIASIIAAAVLVIMELLVFRQWKKNLTLKAAVTQGNMYARTTESYRSANDSGDPEEKHI